jgi:hypothetical protein
VRSLAHTTQHNTHTHTHKLSLSLSAQKLKTDVRSFTLDTVGLNDLWWSVSMTCGGRSQ